MAKFTDLSLFYFTTEIQQIITPMVSVMAQHRNFGGACLHYRLLITFHGGFRPR